MQPAQEVYSTDQLIQSFQSLNNVRRFLEEKQIEIAKSFDKLPDLYFVHSSKSTETIKIIGLPLFSGCEFFWLDEPMCYNTHEDICKSRLINSRSAINWINLNPHTRGALIDASSGSVWKFRPSPPVIPSTDIFKLRFDRDNIETELHEWLWEKIRAIYDAWDCPDLKKDPLDGKREALWHEALTVFRPYHQRTYSVNTLPELSYNFLSFDTLKNNIIHITTMGHIKHSD